jgi:RNA polymerase sigma-70 factor, ECF subfamily
MIAVEPREHARLVDEASRRRCMQHFEGDLTLELWIAREIHDAHRARAEHLLDLEPADRGMFVACELGDDLAAVVARIEVCRQLADSTVADEIEQRMLARAGLTVTAHDAGSIDATMTAGAQLEQHLVTVHEAARRRWPALDVDQATFVAHAAERYPAGVALEQWCAEELYLTCALVAANPRALAIFDAEYLVLLDRTLARFADAALVDDARQILRERLLVRVDVDTPPRIATFTGKGSLAKWLEVAGLRTAISMRRKRRETTLDTRALAELQGASPDPRLAHLKQTYLAQFTEAWRRALRELEPRDRTLLRLHLLDRLSVERLGLLYGVHATTAARWIRQIRDRLSERIHHAMRELLSVSEDELANIVALIRSQLDVTLTELLSKNGELAESTLVDR